MKIAVDSSSTRLTETPGGRFGTARAFASTTATMNRRWIAGRSCDQA